MVTPSWEKPKPDVVDQDILRARIAATVPLTDEFYTAQLPTREKVFRKELKDWSVPFTEPPEPTFEHLRNGYLVKLARQYEDAQGIQPPVEPGISATDEDVSVGDSPITNINDFKKLGAPQARTGVIAPYNEAIQKSKHQDDCLFLKWFETSMGPEKHFRLLEVTPDESIDVGLDSKGNLFADCSKKIQKDSERVANTKRQRKKDEAKDLETKEAKRGELAKQAAEI